MPSQQAREFQATCDPPACFRLSRGPAVLLCPDPGSLAAVAEATGLSVISPPPDDQLRLLDSLLCCSEPLLSRVV